MNSPVQISSLAALRDYVLRKLCSRENLIVEQFTLQETVLLRRGVDCGRQYTLHGPRSVRLGAVWAADRNDLFFYDACGERFHKERVAVSVESAVDAA